MLCAASLAALFALPSNAMAQTGVDDDRVSLPEGPGSLEGVGDDVSINPNMGGMSHSIAINLPSGFVGASPSLGLSYSSSAGASVVGMGWSMSVPSIERMTSRGAPTYDTADLFDTGGAELVQVGEDGGDLIFRQRFEGSFVRYRWVDAGAGDEGYWIAEYRDGSRGYFGANSRGELAPSARLSHPSKGTAGYMLVEKVDPYGNAVTYTYDRLDGTVPLLTGIAWVDDGSGSPLYTAEIDYEMRPDHISDASRNFEEITANRVTAVRAKHGSETIREYVLSYQGNEMSGGFSRLARVEHYGLGGRALGNLYEVVHSFDYSQALGVECTGNDCDRPYMVVMGDNIGAAANFASGRATMIDIDKDGLADLVDTTDPGAHQFYKNTLTLEADGSFSHTFSPGAASGAPDGTGAAIQLGGAVQTFDVNGDGTSDLFNRTTGQYLLNDPASDDWGAAGTLADATALQNIDLSQARFIDLDDDKRVDLLTSTTTTTTYHRNAGDTFITSQIAPIGAAVQADSRVQFADMNGDGLNDPVELRQDGSLRYRLNYGLGDWGPWRNVVGLTLTPTERDRADLEDLNGDGIADVVIVNDGEVKYALNANGDAFEAMQMLTSADIDGVTIPDRGAGVSVLFADMNANGSEDVVWFLPGGRIQYLELFPVRPNLMTRVDNGLGFVQRIAYTTAAEEAARARAEGQPWTHHLSIPMQMVHTVDRFVTLTGGEDGSGLHEITRMSYRDGFYDGDEKQYRGFERVEQVVDGDEFQEESLLRYVFDVGRAVPHRNGLTLEQAMLSDGEVLTETRSTFEDCDLDGVPSNDMLLAQGREAIFYPCMVSTEVIHKERLEDPSSWVTTRSEMTYDGYGNVTLDAKLGVVGVSGDELYTETSYVTPTTRWLIGVPSRVEIYADPEGPRGETVMYYDGEDFIGLPEGEATHGFMTRVTNKPADGEVIESKRVRRDQFGNIAEKIEPNGSIEDETRYRRVYEYDASGLFRTATLIRNVDREGEPYTLRRDVSHSRVFQKVEQISKWTLERDGQAQTSKVFDLVRYDEFGRTAEVVLPGQDASKPGARYIYELGEPFSRIIKEFRSTPDGPFDERAVVCLDGKGRNYQRRTTIAEGRHQVSDFTVYNARGKRVAKYQPYESDTLECDREPAANAKRLTFRYDAMGRLIEERMPGEEIYGEPVVNRTEFLPLEARIYDGEDTSDGPHADTPKVRTYDGLSRVLSTQRVIDTGGGKVTTGEALFYDAIGAFAGFEDASGNRHTIERDLMGRVVAVTNPDFGTLRYVLDDAGNSLATTDARGVTTEQVYDGMNRLVESFDPADPENTRTIWHYDVAPAWCDATECTNVAGEVAAVTYPVDLGDRVEVGRDRVGYDARRRQIFVGRAIGDWIDLKTTQGYDNQDRMSQIVHPDGTTIDFEFDAASRITAIDGFADAIRYTPHGQLESIDFANGVREQRGYDDLLRLSKITTTGVGDSAIHDLALTRNRADAISSITDGGGDEATSLTADYTLDDWYRSVSAQWGERSQQVELDLLDRVTEGPGGAYSYGEGSKQVTSVGEMAYAHDAAGHLVRRGPDSYKRDHLGHIVEVSRDGEVTGRQVFKDAERVLQMTTDGALIIQTSQGFQVRDGVANTYVINESRRIARHESTTLAADIYPDAVADGEINAGDAYVARVAGDETLPTAHVLAAAAARMLSEREHARTFLHTDHVGSIVAATDEGGEVRGKRGYDLWGNERFATGHVDWHGFTGQEYDVTTGFWHMKYRDLDPHSGRWDRYDPLYLIPTADEMSSHGSAATGYAYANNQTSYQSDPSGLDPSDKKMTRAKKAPGFSVDVDSSGAGLGGEGEGMSLATATRTLQARRKFKSDIESIGVKTLKKGLFRAHKIQWAASRYAGSKLGSGPQPPPGYSVPGYDPATRKAKPTFKLGDPEFDRAFKSAGWVGGKTELTAFTKYRAAVDTLKRDFAAAGMSKKDAELVIVSVQRELDTDLHGLVRAAGGVRRYLPEAYRRGGFIASGED